MSKTLYVFTNYFPYGKTTEEAFLVKELNHLYYHFEKIILVPRYQIANDLLPNVCHLVDTDMLKTLAKRNKSAGKLWLNKYVLHELFFLSRIGKIDRARKLWWSLNTILNVIDWFTLKKLKDNDFMFYTYWLTDVTTGLAMAKVKSCKNFPLISRAHGYDLYEERASFHYFPLREFTLQSVDRLFLISKNGLDYIGSKYPKWKDKYDMMKLGVEIPKEQPARNEKEIIKIVSCAGLRPVKRIGLLCDAIDYFGAAHGELTIKWNHFGGGDPADEKQFQKKIREMPINVQCTYWGQVSNQTVIDYYKKNYVDFFLSVSESEGIPVSMMEAMSFGIPVIATAVGGVPEIVTEENGYLLRANPSIEDISNVIYTAVIDRSRNKYKREMCRRIISENFNAEINYSQFANEIRRISES